MGGVGTVRLRSGRGVKEKRGGEAVLKGVNVDFVMISLHQILMTSCYLMTSFPGDSARIVHYWL